MFWKKKASPIDALRAAAKDQQAGPAEAIPSPAPTAAGPDANHAAHVRSLARQLNAAIRAAEGAGLQVRTATDGTELIDGRYRTAAVVVRVYRPI